jgi:hypothetical protein
MGPLIEKEDNIRNIRLSTLFVTDVKVEGEFMNGEHLVITCTLDINNKRIRTFALMDCGATEFTFIDSDFVSHHLLKTKILSMPRQLEVIDGRPIESGDITHIAYGQLDINSHIEKLLLFITKLGHYPIVLGIPWLQQHDPTIGWKANQIIFNSNYYMNKCISKHIVTSGISIPIPESSSTTRTNLNILIISGALFTRLAKNNRKRHGDLKIFSLSLYEIN